MKKIKYILIGFLFIAAVPAWAGGMTSGKVKDTSQLKKYMEEFGSQVIGMQILKQSKTKDWNELSKVLEDMEKTVKDLRVSDKYGAYKSFIDGLDQVVQDMKTKLDEKNKKAYFKSFDDLQNACFHCHITHRPLSEPNKDGFEYSKEK